jgi:hypothetical protein
MLPGFSPFERNVLLAMYKDDYLDARSMHTRQGGRNFQQDVVVSDLPLYADLETLRYL